MLTAFAEEHPEASRLLALKDLRLLDTAPSENFDRLTRMASSLFKLPIAAVSLTDTDRQWFKSRIGVNHWTIPREKAPCAAVAESRSTLVIEDFLADPLYRDSYLARIGIRFYAGAPLVTSDGFGLGAFCVLGTEPRTACHTELATLSDLASMAMAQIELQHAFGRVDPISRLPNRVQFVEDYDDLVNDRQNGEQRLAVVIDLIALDQINHATRVMGPTIIDETVREASRNLSAIIGTARTAYHVGLTQLAFLTPAGTDEEAYRALLIERADSLRRLCGPIAIGTPAIGVVPVVLGEVSASDALRLAQGAAQDARAAGQLFAFHSSNQDSAFQRSYTLLRDYETAVCDFAQMHLVYQPRIDTLSGRCTGAEALMRWTHPTLGAVPPGEFIPLIEQTPLATATTAWVIATAAAQLAQWRDQGLDLTISVNISAANLREPDFASAVERILSCHRLNPCDLELELTETAIMSNAEVALRQIKQLATAGVRLAIDDFGTGYSSLSYLQRLPVQVVKIDRSFVTDLDTKERQRSMVTMMTAMARHLGCRVVAEGAETAAEVESLKASGCQEIQGYFFARPMPPKLFRSWMVGHQAGELCSAG